MIKSKSKDWKIFHSKSLKYKKYPKYPQELMLKTIFGRYSQLNLNINKKSKILDVGCGFGNNLVPFIDLVAWYVELKLIEKFVKLQTIY